VSRRRLTLTLAAVLIGAAAGVGAIVAARGNGSSSPDAQAYRGSIPPAGIRLPGFALPRYNGGSVRSSALRGRVVLTTFVDSACREKCPIIVAIIGRTLPRLAPTERAQLVPLAFSVHPTVDTPARVHRFLALRHALELKYLVGSVKQMRPVWKQFHILPAVDTGSADVHSADVRIFNREGMWVSTLHAGVDLTPPNLVHDIRLALNQP
jgi:cytochrome oxidase Cu insertion factor (SCO1/SenC/PrrC family)